MRKLFSIFLVICFCLVCSGLYAQNSLKKLFTDEDYEEIIGLLKDKPISKLNFQEAYYLGYSYMMLGKLSTALKCLLQGYKSASTPKEQVKISEIIARIYFYSLNYQGIIKILSPLNVNLLSDRAKYYYAVALLNTGELDEAHIVINLIKNPVLRERLTRLEALLYGVKVFGQINQIYDSNIKLVEDETTKKSGFVSEGLFSVIDYSPVRSFQLIGFASFKNNRDYSAYDIYYASFKHIRKYSGIKFILPQIDFVYANEGAYSAGMKLGIERGTYLKIKLTGGYEHNFQDTDRNALSISCEGSFKFFHVRVMYKNFKNYYDKVLINPLIYFNKKLSNKFYLKTRAGMIYLHYLTMEDRALRPYGSVTVSWGFTKNQCLNFKGEIEKNFLLKKDVGYEKEYFKYIVGIGYSYYF